jgi:hypothetical protein
LFLPEVLNEFTVIVAIDATSTGGGGSSGFESCQDSLGNDGGGSLGVGGIIYTQSLTGTGASGPARQDPFVLARVGKQVWAAAFPPSGQSGGFFSLNRDRNTAARGISTPGKHRRFGNKSALMASLTRFYEVIYYDRLLTPAECVIMADWMADKHSIDMAPTPYDLTVGEGSGFYGFSEGLYGNFYPNGNYGTAVVQHHISPAGDNHTWQISLAGGGPIESVQDILVEVLGHSFLCTWDGAAAYVSPPQAALYPLVQAQLGTTIPIVSNPQFLPTLLPE